MAGDSGTIFIYFSIWISSAQHNLQPGDIYVYIFEIKLNL